MRKLLLTLALAAGSLVPVTSTAQAGGCEDWFRYRKPYLYYVTRCDGLQPWLRQRANALVNSPVSETIFIVHGRWRPIDNRRSRIVVNTTTHSILDAWVRVRPRP